MLPPSLVKRTEDCRPSLSQILLRCVTSNPPRTFNQATVSIPPRPIECHPAAQCRVSTANAGDGITALHLAGASPAFRCMSPGNSAAKLSPLLQTLPLGTFFRRIWTPELARDTCQAPRRMATLEVWFKRRGRVVPGSRGKQADWPIPRRAWEEQPALVRETRGPTSRYF